MRLYHFTAAHLLPGIMREGLTLGGVPTIPPGRREPTVVWGYQWLTANASFSQSWCDPAHRTLPYDRTAVRLTIQIPRLRRDRLWRWLHVCDRLTTIADVLSTGGDPEHWWLYRGRLPQQYIVGAVSKERRGVATAWEAP